MAEQLSPTQLIVALQSERRQRWQKGDRVLAEAFFQRYPVLHTDPTCAVELIYHEVLLRAELGEDPRPEEYLRRFPRYAAQLGPLFEVHQAIEGGQVFDTPSEQGSRDRGPTRFAEGGDSHLPSVPGYEVLDRLGRGGMGVVYRARHERLNRVVALKMILAGADAEERELARFRAEAEAQARLQHPHIVQIYEIGETAGRPYFALEYVDGGSLNRTEKPLPARQAAQLVAILAEAVHYAHQRGVVHRDLKPANVLMTAGGMPKVTDFGLAKRLEGGESQTKSGEIVGTALYMAPEQATAEGRPVGPGVDVYSLGAILYELVTGRPPFLAETALDTLIQARTLEPVPPRRLQPKVPRDLETICLKCLRKDGRKRYAEAQGLAEDLRRFLAGEPIRARPVGVAGRLWRWCRRKPAVASLLAALVAVVLGAYAAVTWQLFQTRQAQAAEAKHRQVAEKQRELALDTLNLLVIDVQKELRHRPNMHRLRQSVLETALSRLKQVVEEYGPSEAVDRARGHAYANVAEVAQALGQTAEAATWYGKAHEVFLSLATATPSDSQAQRDLAFSFGRLGGVDLLLGNTVAARDHFQQRLEICEQLHRASPQDQRADQDLAFSYERMGEVRLQLGDRPGALKYHQQALGLREEVQAADPLNANVNAAVGTSCNHIGEVSLQLGDAEAARKYHERARAIFERVGTEHPEDSQIKRALALANSKLGNANLELKDMRSAEQCYERTRTLYEEMRAEDPQNMRINRELTVAYGLLGEMTLKGRQYKKASEWFERALKLGEQLRTIDPRNVDIRRDQEITLQKLGDVSTAQGDLKGAQTYNARSLTICQELHTADPNNARIKEDLSQMYLRVGETSQALGDLKGAQDHYHHHLVLCQELLTATPKTQGALALAFLRMGEVNQAERQFAAARKHFDGAAVHYALARAADAKNPEIQRNLAVVNLKLGEVIQELGNLPTARDHFQQSQVVFAQLRAEFPRSREAQRDLAIIGLRLGGIFQRLGDLRAAREQLGQARELYAQLRAADPENIERAVDWGDCCGALGSLEMFNRDFATALRVFESGVAILKPLEAAGKLTPSPQAQRLLKALQGRVNNCQEALRAIENLEYALGRPPKQAARLLKARSGVLADRGQTTEAAATAERLRELAGEDPGLLVDVAGCFALCATAVAGGKSLAQLPPASQSAHQRYTTSALEALAQALAQGYNNVARLEGDPDMASLRSQAEFRRLLADLKKRP